MVHLILAKVAIVGAKFAPMTFAGKQNHLSNSNVGGEQYNYSIPSDNNFYPIMHHN